MARKTALVTGGMGGLGTAICKRLALDGCVVIANCLPGYPEKEKWLEGVKADGYSNIVAAEGDVSDYDSCGNMVNEIHSKIGKVDILINNAGITRDSVFKKMEKKDWEAVIDINLNSVFNVTRFIIEDMIGQNWGRVINISSVNAQKGQFGQANYSAAKAGIHGFTKALAQEVAKKGVTINSISPGYIATDMVTAIKPEILEQIVAQIPVGRLGKPEEVAALVSYLASEDAAYVTGSNVSINGGLYMF